VCSFVISLFPFTAGKPPLWRAAEWRRLAKTIKEQPREQSLTLTRNFPIAWGLQLNSDALALAGCVYVITTTLQLMPQQLQHINGATYINSTMSAMYLMHTPAHIYNITKPAVHGKLIVMLEADKLSQIIKRNPSP